MIKEKKSKLKYKKKHRRPTYIFQSRGEREKIIKKLTGIQTLITVDTRRIMSKKM